MRDAELIVSHEKSIENFTASHTYWASPKKNGKFVSVRLSEADMGRKVIVAVCSLNQWALDFSENSRRIIESE